MTTTISFADWVDWLAFELTFTALYESAAPSLKQELTATVLRLAEGPPEADRAAFVSRVPNFERALSSFSAEERHHFDSQLSRAVSELACHVATLPERGREAVS
ncbi:hypothetical protein [Candidatus Palauibacter sp.]|uniref:hypothetical protein n=1 Tax=Candidatus Palauibacter sp. TaxID=3101350 RepID=UPI003B02DFC1